MELSEKLQSWSFTEAEMACILDISEDHLKELRESEMIPKGYIPPHDGSSYAFTSLYELESYLRNDIPRGDSKVRQLSPEIMQRVEAIVADKTSPEEAAELRKSYDAAIQKLVDEGHVKRHETLT